jgi:hypothetical protein
MQLFLKPALAADRLQMRGTRSVTPPRQSIEQPKIVWTKLGCMRGGNAQKSCGQGGNGALQPSAKWNPGSHHRIRRLEGGSFVRANSQRRALDPCQSIWPSAHEYVLNEKHINDGGRRGSHGNRYRSPGMDHELFTHAPDIQDGHLIIPARAGAPSPTKKGFARTRRKAAAGF